MLETAQFPARIALALGVAILFHLALLALLGRIDWSPEPPARTAVTLVVTRAEVAASDTSSAPPDESSRTPVVTSTASDTPVTFKRPQQLPQHNALYGAPRTDTRWVEQMFTADQAPVVPPTDSPETAQDQIPQTSHEPFRVLSPYHQRLLQLLSQHQQAFDSLDRDRRVLMTLKLHPTGALLRATIETSSGNPDIDAAAQRTAYAASPFPPPPATDEALSFTYPVEILYRREH